MSRSLSRARNFSVRSRRFGISHAFFFIFGYVNTMEMAQPHDGLGLGISFRCQFLLILHKLGSLIQQWSRSLLSRRQRPVLHRRGIVRGGLLRTGSIGSCTGTEYCRWSSALNRRCSRCLRQNCPRNRCRHHGVRIPCAYFAGIWIDVSLCDPVIRFRAVGR